MIALLTGTIVEIELKSLIVDAGGVGYRVSVLGALLAKAEVGEKITLRIYHQVSDDAETLYGFEDKVGLEYFNLLLSVPSVGPRTAIGVLDVAPPRVLAQAVAQNDIKILTRISGVGKKTAERIMVELKGKIKAEVEGAETVSGDIQEETVAALTSIGFTTAQANAAASKLSKDVKTVEEAVREALRTKS